MDESTWLRENWLKYIRVDDSTSEFMKVHRRVDKSTSELTKVHNSWWNYKLQFQLSSTLLWPRLNFLQSLIFFGYPKPKGNDPGNSSSDQCNSSENSCPKRSLPCCIVITLFRKTFYLKKNKIKNKWIGNKLKVKITTVYKPR